MTAVLQGTHKTRTPLGGPARDELDPAAGTPCSRRGCYAYRDGYPHSYYMQTEERHGICVAESRQAREFARPETWPDYWSVHLEAIGDEPWRVEVVMHAQSWPKKPAHGSVFGNYVIPDPEELGAALVKAERSRKRLTTLAESEGSR